MRVNVIFSLALGFGILGVSWANVARAQDVGAGQGLYENHCQNCHGPGLDGNGALAGAMIMKPKALNNLSALNGGEFPVLSVVRRIDGRAPLVSHGSPMPVFGPFFEGDDTALKTAAGQPIMTSRAIADLVAYLKREQQ